VPTPHDSPGSVALVVDDGDCRLGIATDLGVVTPEIVEAFQGVDGLVLEMNHDLQMLATGPYPEYLKKRIRGRFGHLSNEQGAELLASVHGPDLQQVTLAHLSEHNNTERLAQAAAARVLEEVASSARLSVARPRQVGQPVDLRRRKRRISLGY
jgi:phosphoribosyl 1,2-cyclic phosphodiesterase